MALEHIVLNHLQPHLLKLPNFSKYQSVYGPGYSTETAMLGVLNRIYNAIDKGNVVVMVCLDVSAVFNTIHYAEDYKKDYANSTVVLFIGCNHTSLGIIYSLSVDNYYQLGQHAAPEYPKAQSLAPSCSLLTSHLLAMLY